MQRKKIKSRNLYKAARSESKNRRRVKNLLNVLDRIKAIIYDGLEEDMFINNEDEDGRVR